MLEVVVGVSPQHPNRGGRLVVGADLTAAPRGGQLTGSVTACLAKLGWNPDII